jgi:integrase
MGKLTARTIASLKTPGSYGDGQNLMLVISKIGTSLSRRWIFRYVIAGKQRDGGFGPVARTTLAEARAKAKEWRALLDKGIDPLDQKKAALEAVKKRKTFGECADELFASKRASWRNAKHAAQWRATIFDYCGPLLDTPINEVDTTAVLAVLQPLWAKIPETASRLRGRIEAVIDYATAHGLRVGPNPAAWRNHLALILPPARPKLSRGRFAAMDYRDVAAFIDKLRATESAAARALEFAILTAARSGEVLGAGWDEIDLAGKTWTIPPARMKAGREHRVPLSEPALRILARMAERRMASNLVFPGWRHGRPTDGTSLRRLCPDGATPHGFRSSFRDWAGEETNFPREVCEQALAHATGSAVEQAYRRGDTLEKRRILMDAWASFCEPQNTDNVVTLRNVK